MKKRINAFCKIAIRLKSMAVGFFISLLNGADCFFKKYKGTYILCFHDVYQGNESGDVFSISANCFENLLKTIKDNVISIDEVARDKHSNDRINFVLTFDDGYKSFYTTVFPLLVKYNIPAIVYVTTSYIGIDGYLSPDNIADLSKNPNITIGSHMVTHSKSRLLDDEEIEKEWIDSSKYLESICSRKIEHGALPYGSILSCSKQSFLIGLNCGYKTIANTLPRKQKQCKRIINRFVYEKSNSTHKRVIFSILSAFSDKAKE